MKQISLSEFELDTLRQSCQTIDDLLVEVERHQQLDGQVVCQFIINGMRMSEDDELRMKSLSVKDLESLTVHFDNPDNLLVEIIHNWKLELPKMIEHADQLSQQISNHGIENHIASFIQLVESCQLFVQSLMSLSNVINTHHHFPSGQWMLAEQQLSTAVGEALSTFDKKETRTLADVIEYDLANALVSWIEIFELLATTYKKEV
jgi:hypothetical protein